MEVVAVSEVRPEHFDHPVSVTIKFVPRVSPHAQIEVKTNELATALAQKLAQLEVGNTTLSLSEIVVHPTEWRVQFA